jgi:tetratricopeptide (TPR) repeat protein
LHLVVVGALGLLLLGGGAFAWWQDRQATARREEKAREQERARRNTDAALAQSADLRHRALWTPAETALNQALAALGPDADPTLRDRLEAARRETRFLARLDQIRDGGFDVSINITLDAYRAIFAEHGFDLPRGDEADLARRVAAHPLRDELVAALDDWAALQADAKTRDDLGSKIWEVTARVTGEAGRRDLAAAWNDGSRLKAVVDRIDPGRASPAFLAMLGYRLDRNGQDGLTFLRWACVRHPADFWVHLATGNALSSNRHKRYADAAGYYRAALAIRPGSIPTWNRLGNALTRAGDFDGAVASYHEWFRLDPRYYRITDTLAAAHHVRGLDRRDRGDLDGAAADFQEAVRLLPWWKDFEEDLQQVRRWRELLATLPDVAAGRAHPKTPAEALEFADLCRQSFQRRYILATRLAAGAFAADPQLADEIVTDSRFDRATRTQTDSRVSRRYLAARWAVLAAAGKDADATAVGVEEWGHLTELAHRWLRADLAGWPDRAKDPGRRTSAYWKHDPDLAAVRDPAWLAAMPPSDRKRWEAFWADVDALLLATTPPARAPPPRPKVK